MVDVLMVVRRLTGLGPYNMEMLVDDGIPNEWTALLRVWERLM